MEALFIQVGIANAITVVEDVTFEIGNGIAGLSAPQVDPGSSGPNVQHVWPGGLPLTVNDPFNLPGCQTEAQQFPLKRRPLFHPSLFHLIKVFRQRKASPCPLQPLSDLLFERFPPLFSPLLSHLDPFLLRNLFSPFPINCPAIA